MAITYQYNEVSVQTQVDGQVIVQFIVQDTYGNTVPASGIAQAIQDYITSQVAGSTLNHKVSKDQTLTQVNL